MDDQVSQLTLVEVFRALSEIPLNYKDRTAALQQITALGKETLGSHACTLTFVDLEGRTMIQAACAGFDPDFQKRMASRRIKLGSSAQGEAIDYDLVAKGEEVEAYNLQENGQGIAKVAVARRYGLKSVLAYPLKSDGKLIGYFNHFSARLERFTPRERLILEMFADQAMITIQHLEDLEKLRNAQQLSELNEIMRQMTEAPDLNSLLELMLDKGLKLVGAERGWISRLDPNTGELPIVSVRGKPTHMRTLRLGQGITGRALREEKPVRVDDVLDRRWQGAYLEYWPDTRSELAVPILVSNARVRVRKRIEFASKAIGVLNLESPSASAFSATDGNLLWSLARHAAVMLERLDFERKVAELMQIHAEIAGKQDWDDVIRSMLSAIRNTLGYERVNISLVDAERKRIKTEYIIGLPDEEARAFKRLADHPLDSTDVQADIVRRGEIEVPDVDDERFDPRVYKRFHHERLIRVFVPMIRPSDNQVIGTVEAAYPRQYRPRIYEQDVEVLKRFVDYTVAALEKRQRGLLDRVSHELKTPIVGIRNNASFLQRRVSTLDTTLVQRKFDDILMDCEILLLQVRELEHILGRTSPPAKPERTLIFRDILIKTIRQLTPLIKEQGFDPSRVRYNPSDMRRIRPLVLDRAQMNQVVYNLIINAIKYAEEDAGQFAVSIEVEESKGAYTLAFKDWGIGVSREYADRVFDEGVRAPEAVRRNVTGSGLGLTIARRIMRDLGGDLRLASLSKPTEFRVILPKSLEEVPG